VRSVKFGELKFEIAMKIGSSVPEICGFAEDHDVDLIITSTHGRTGLEHVLIGSIAEQVVRHASCPVLVVPSHPKTRVAKLRRRSRSINQRAMRIAPVNAAVMSFCASQMSPWVPR
jgi:Universal stress protein family